MRDPYQVLGVSPNATDDEIKRAYRILAKKYHPDLNPGDENAARKMQEVNAAYEQIKNPEKTQQSSQTGYDPFGGYQRSYQQEEDPYQQRAYRYIRMGRHQEALNILSNSTHRNAQWYYLSALANNGLGNDVTAMEHIRKAVSMEPDNPLYLQTLRRMQAGETAYLEQAGSYKGFSMRGSPCASMCLCYLLQIFCCRGRICCC